jgi:GT2 family glycosyltransferase
VAAAHAGCEALLFLNNDVIFPQEGGALLRMYDALMSRPDYGIVCTWMWFDDGTLQHGGIDFLKESSVYGLCYHPRARERMVASDVPEFREMPAVTGACLMIRRDVFELAGMFDEGYASECQDVALCLSVHRLGRRIGLVGLGHVVHLENATRPKGEENWVDRQRYLRHWSSYIEATFT